MKKNIIISILLINTLLITGCSLDETLQTFGYSSISEVKDDIIDKVSEFANQLHIDNFEQQYKDSGLESTLDELIETFKDSYEELDYTIDTSNMDLIYESELDTYKLEVYIDNENNKVYIVDYEDERTKVFSGKEWLEWFYSNIYKASGIDMNSY